VTKPPSCQADHPWIEIEGVHPACCEALKDDLGADAPPAADLEHVSAGDAPA
jgi:hypothetical protein